jgi:hypothetical protein
VLGVQNADLQRKAEVVGRLGAEEQFRIED